MDVDDSWSRFHLHAKNPFGSTLIVFLDECTGGYIFFSSTSVSLMTNMCDALWSELPLYVSISTDSFGHNDLFNLIYLLLTKPYRAHINFFSTLDGLGLH